MVVLKTATAPLQGVNLLIQSQNEMIKSGRMSHAYKGISDCIARTVRNEGFISLWRGNSASVLHFVSGMQSWETTVILTGGVGICCDLATYPIDTVRRRMMMRSLYKGTSAFVLVHVALIGFLVVIGNTLLKIANVSPEKSRSGGVVGPEHQGSGDSPTVTPTTSSSVGIPSKKGNATGQVFRSLMWTTNMMATAPVNRVMVLMRCQNEMIKSGRLSHPYKGIGDCFARTVRNEGIISLWKGNTAQMMGSITAKFNGIIDVFRKTLKSDGIAGLYRGYKMMYVADFVRDVIFFVLQPKRLLLMLGFQELEYRTSCITEAEMQMLTWNFHESQVSTWDFGCQNEMIRSGRLSHPYKGIGDCLVRTVRNEGILSLGEETLQAFFQRCHPRLPANKANKRQFDGLIDVYRKTLKSDGIAGLYRGYNIALVESIAGSIFLLGSRFTLRPLLMHVLGPLWLQHSILAAAVRVSAEFCARFPTYPLDPLHRRMMMRSGEAVKYKSSSDAFSQIRKMRELSPFITVYFLQLCLLSGLAMVGAKILPEIFMIPRKNKSGKQPYRIVIYRKNSKDGGTGNR
ncbi:hypothetical protein QYF36_025142 [Acer negundo]|nr:hypothetical protein QYF36_025142 [Acer negundo]